MIEPFYDFRQWFNLELLQETFRWKKIISVRNHLVLVFLPFLEKKSSKKNKGKFIFRTGQKFHMSFVFGQKIYEIFDQCGFGHILIFKTA